jgi:hypothetical protein
MLQWKTKAVVAVLALAAIASALGVHHFNFTW